MAESQKYNSRDVDRAIEQVIGDDNLQSKIDEEKARAQSAEGQLLDAITDVIGTMIPYYAVCTSNASTQYKSVSVPNVMVMDMKPNEGLNLVVRFVNGNTAKNANVKIESKSNSYPIYCGDNPIAADAMSANCVLELVFDATQERWYVVGSTGVNLPQRYVSNYNVLALIEGRYKNYAEELYAELVGSGLVKKFVSQQTMMLFKASYTALEYVDEHSNEETNTYAFSCVHSSKYYEFSISPTKVTIIDDGTDMATNWIGE